MKQIKQIISITLLICMMMTVLMPIDTYAGTIDRISLTVTHNTSVGDILEPTIEVSTDNCTIDDIEWSKDISKWKVGSYVICTVTLSCDPADVFKSGSSVKKYVYTRTDGDYSATQCDHYTGTKIDDTQYKFSFRYYPIVQLDAPSRAGWSDVTKTKATWSRVPGSPGYQIELYEQYGDKIATVTTTDTMYDFTSSIKQDKLYYYEIRSMARDSDDKKRYITSDWKESEDTIVSYDPSQDITSETAQSDLKNQWSMIDGNWYYYGVDGYPVKGWISSSDGKWYYMNTEGKMQIGWVKDITGNWYYLGQDGAMKIGWYEDNPGEWYYSYPNGVMAKSTKIDGYSISSTGLAE